MSGTKRYTIDNLTIDKLIKYNERALEEINSDSKYASGEQQDALQKAVREHLVTLRKVRAMK